MAIKIDIQPKNGEIVSYNVTGSYVIIYNTNTNEYDNYLVSVNVKTL